MSTKDINLFHHMIHRKNNIDFLEDMTIADYPNMSKTNKTKLHREIFKLAHPESQQERIIRVEDIGGAIR